MIGSHVSRGTKMMEFSCGRVPEYWDSMAILEFGVVVVAGLVGTC